jgi:nucleoside-diphosphate-sugar epimerase
MAAAGVLVTGASGFVGRALVPRLQRAGMPVWVTSRSETTAVPRDATRVVWPAGGDETALREALHDTRAVVHLAARVHVMDETLADPMAAYRAANVDATMDLARAAQAGGVERFVFVSSVKVFGETGHFRETDRPAPKDPYGQSKFEAEEQLRAFGRTTGMDVVVVRPPLVYGPGVKANFAALIRLVSRKLPLPLGAVHNRRSYVAVENLADGIHAILAHGAPVNDTFTITDAVDLSTADLIRRMAAVMGHRATLIPIPPSLLHAVATMMGRQAAMTRLLGSLTFETGRLTALTGWTPPLSVDDGLRQAVTEAPR